MRTLKGTCKLEGGEEQGPESHSWAWLKWGWPACFLFGLPGGLGERRAGGHVAPTASWGSRLCLSGGGGNRMCQRMDTAPACDKARRSVTS